MSPTLNTAGMAPVEAAAWPNVITLPSRRAAPTSPTTGTQSPDLIALHAQACNGLHAALRHLTDVNAASDAQMFTAALARATQATMALKRACAAQAEGGTA